MKQFFMIFISLSNITYAGCLPTVKKMLQLTEMKLITETSHILKPGEESLAYGGEFYNNTKVTAEVFFLTESNRYYQNYTALLLNARTCAPLARQALSDNN